ncbi:uroporphyrinogen decarboxylase [Arctopsyche grandis]|uniref:uroporphyrinogen decarboxylase n=1 Tax=Arctopsyche grandis TaxID=121162 RepID=UPI00406D77B2
MSINIMPFPPLKNDRLLKAARGEEVDEVPVWVMRQAGRYLPEFQEVRAKHDFFEVCRTPELACEVTLQPLRRFEHLDASIIFSDILVIPQAIGMTVEMHPGKGPVFPNPLEKPEDIDTLDFNDPVGRLKYVGNAITLTRHSIAGKVPLIGFTGAPWTLMGYMIEGGGSKTMEKSKKWIENHLVETKRLLGLLTDVIVDYLIMQVEAGAQLLQIFESSAEHLSPEQFVTISMPYLRQIPERVRDGLQKKSIPTVPMTIFAKGAGHSLNLQAKMGYDVIGIDWTVDPVKARQDVGPNITLQGNLDPQDLYKPQDEIRQMTIDMARKFGKHRYIANLGHGITPATPIDSMHTFTEAIHSAF